MTLRDVDEAIAVGPAAAPRRWSAVARGWLARPDVRAALVATLSLRVLCSAVAVAMPLLLPSFYPWLDPYGPDHVTHVTYAPGTPLPRYTPLDYLVQPWNRWDTAWLTDIAQHGYVAFGSSFFMPLYPLLVRLAAPFTGNDFVAAALVVATVAAFFVMWNLYRLAERLAPGRRLGPYALLVAALLPTSFFLVAGYTESVFLALALGAILAALEERWWRMALLGALAALTRQQGVLLGALAVPAIWAWSGWAAGRLRAARDTARAPRAGPPAPAWQPVLAGVAPAAAYGGWILVLRFVFHAPLPWTLLHSTRAGWDLHLTWPGSGVLADLMLIAHPAAGQETMILGAVLDAGMSLAAAAALVVAARRLPVGLTLYLAGMWCSALVKVLPSGLTSAEGRYMLGMLPLCIMPAGVLARGGATRRITWVVIGTASLAIYLAEFVLWGWVG